MRDVSEVAGKGDRNRGHSARLDDQKQGPAIEKGGKRPERIAKIGILSAHRRAPRGQLCVNTAPRSAPGQAAEHPDPDDQQRRVDVPRDLGRVDENARADDSAHDEHGRVEQAQPPRQAVAIPPRRHSQQFDGRPAWDKSPAGLPVKEAGRLRAPRARRSAGSRPCGTGPAVLWPRNMTS